MHISKALEKIRDGTFKRPSRCLLCGRESEDVGIFFPYEPMLFGGQKGKGRLIIYASCEQCRRALGADAYKEQIELLMRASPRLTNTRTLERN